MGESCPHTRGDDPDVLLPPVPDSLLVPIRVGMILDMLPALIDLLACPHTRGDDP